MIYRARSLAIRLYVLRRADGYCEGCTLAAPFRSADGSPFLEAHHTKRLADDGPDHPAKVIGLCPNCHRRAHHAGDALSFNASLIRKLPKLEAASKKG
jgi:5-methylcytosine-specific restriction protein A